MKCPLCGSSDLKKLNITTQEAQEKRKMLLEKCAGCGVIFSEDYKTNRNYIYGENYAAWNNISEGLKSEQIKAAKKKAFKEQLEELLRHIPSPKGKVVLDIGAGGGYLLDCAQEIGFDCYGTEISFSSGKNLEKKFPGKIRIGEIEKDYFPENFFDVIFMTDVMEHLSDPKKNVEEISRIIKSGGYLFIISPNSDSLTRKFFGSNWFQYKYEHVFYYNHKSLGNLLEPFNFQEIIFKNNRKNFSLHYYAAYFQKYSFWGIGKIITKIYPYLPERIKNISFSNPVTGEFIAIYQKKLL